MKSEDDKVVCLFQDKVAELLLKHRSILDSLSKYTESAARVNRAVTKAVTGCGCISIKAQKQEIPAEISFEECRKYMDTHLKGALCESCREIIEEEIANHLFYLSALCHLLNFELEEIIKKEYERLNALGVYHLS